MKMLKCILVFAMLFAVLAGCSKKTQKPIPTETTTQATLAPTETTAAPTQVTIAPTDATQENAFSTDNTEPATQITAAPTESTTVTTQATTATTKPATKSTQATTVATKPATIATQATTVATKPTTLATQATTVATKSAGIVTQAAAVATKPATVATTQATTVSTKPAPTATQGTKPTAHTHSYTFTSDTATCTAAGKKTETCSLCGDQRVTDSPAKGHGATRTETQEATTSAAGYTRVICNTCNGVISETAIPKREAPHTCTMKRINCRDLQDGSVGFMGMETVKFRQYKDFSILACSECGTADTSTLEFIYSSREATAMIVEMINQLRYEVYGTHTYDVVVATHHSAAEWAAEYISNDYQHCVPFPDNIGHENPSGNTVQKLFNSWRNSPGHYSLLIDKYGVYCSLGVCVGDDGSVYASLIICEKNELYLDNPNYTWQFR